MRAPEELAQPSRDQRQQLRQLDLAGERIADLVQGLELAQPAGRGFVEACVFDGHGGLSREQGDDLLVFGGELLPSCLLRQVEVAERPAAKQYRDAEECVHLGVVCGEADRTRICRQVRQAERFCVSDEDAEDAAPARQLADCRMRLGVDADRHKALEPFVRLVDYAERRVAGARQRRRRLRELVEHGIERELGGNGDAGLHESSDALVHGGIMDGVPL